jgi:hypothetical protein
VLIAVYLRICFWLNYAELVLMAYLWQGKALLFAKKERFSLDL